jgi:hypothetical protein
VNVLELDDTYLFPYFCGEETSYYDAGRMEYFPNGNPTWKELNESGQSNRARQRKT